MLPPIDNHDRFFLNPQYSMTEPELAETERHAPVSDYGKVFLVQGDTGPRIETDHIGKRIVEALPASLEELAKTFNNTDYYLSPKLIRYYLLVFWRAGVLKKEPVRTSPGKTREKTPVQVPDSSARISAVLVTYNGESFIRPNLDSLYKQSLAPVEIIIVDNVSTDTTLDIIGTDYPDARIIRNKKNYHYARAVNIGVAAAKGDLVLILNQDLVLDEKLVENLYRRYLEEENKERVGGVVPQMRFSKQPSIINGIGNFVTEKDWGSDNYFCAVDIGQFDNLRYVSSACFGAIMVTKQGWEKVGPLDQVYKSFYEDTDWSIRAHGAGMNLLAAPGATVYHAFGGSYPSGLKLSFVVKNRLRFVFKNLKGKLWKRFFKKYLKQDIRNGISFLRRGPRLPLLYYKIAYLKLLVELPGILVKKRKFKADEELIGRFFTKGAPYVALGNRNLEPVINKHTIRSYYYFAGHEGFQFPPEPILAQ